VAREVRGKGKQHGRNHQSSEENVKLQNSTEKLRTENNSLDNVPARSPMTFQRAIGEKWW
jgi:hypothetical protein